MYIYAGKGKTSWAWFVSIVTVRKWSRTTCEQHLRGKPVSDWCFWRYNVSVVLTLHCAPCYPPVLFPPSHREQTGFKIRI